MKRFVKTLLHNLLLAFLAFVWLVPIVWLVVTSFSAYTGMNTSTFFPKEWSLAQYKNLLFSADSANIALGMRSRTGSRTPSSLHVRYAWSPPLLY